MTFFLALSFFIFLIPALASVWSAPPRLLIVASFFWLLVLVFFVSTKGDGYDLDAHVYMEIFDSIDVDNFVDWLGEKSIEPIFVLAAVFFKYVGLAYWAINLFFVVAAFLLYFYAFRRYGWRCFLVFFLFYFATGFLVREFTQIRFGLSVAFGVAAIADMLDRRYFRVALLLVASIMAHSAGYFIFVYLFAIVLAAHLTHKTLIVVFLGLMAAYLVFAKIYVEDYLFSLPRIARYSDSSEIEPSLSWSIQCILFAVLAGYGLVRRVISKEIFSIALATLMLQICFWNFQILQRGTVYGYAFMGIVLARLLIGGGRGRIVAGVVAVIYFPLSFASKLDGLVL